MSKKVTVQILSGGRLQEPAVLDDIKLERARFGEPSKLTFTCIKDRNMLTLSDALKGNLSPTNKWAETKDGALSFSEGNQVILRYGDKDVFFGYVFEKKRNKDHHIEVTCYDRLRYFKNKENYVFNNVRLDQVVKRVAQDLNFPIGEISNTKYVIPNFVKEDATLFDVIDHASQLTTIATNNTYILYDDYGKICLKSQDELMLDILIDEDTAEDFDYVSSISENTYNQIVVKSSNNESGEPIVLNDNTTQKQWGTLQTVVDSQDGGNAMQKAKLMMEHHNKVFRTLSVNGQFGDIRVRGGSGVYVNLHLGDIKVQQKMWVDSVTHTFSDNDHYMDLTLIDGGRFYG